MVKSKTQNNLLIELKAKNSKKKKIGIIMDEIDGHLFLMILIPI